LEIICMTASDNQSVVIGLYRHDAPEEETLRLLLRWLRDACSLVLSSVRALTSIQEAQSRLDLAQLEVDLEEWHARGKSGLPPVPTIRGFDLTDAEHALIERVIASNNEFPERVLMSPPLSLGVHMRPTTAIEVGYDARRPDDFRVDGRRLISLRVVERFLNLPQEISSPQERYPGCARPVDWAVAFVQRCASYVEFTYASIQSDREPPTPPVLKRSAVPRDWDHVYLRLTRDAIQSAWATLGASEDWKCRQFEQGMMFELRSENLTASGREYMERLRALVLSKLN